MQEFCFKKIQTQNLGSRKHLLDLFSDNSASTIFSASLSVLFFFFLFFLFFLGGGIAQPLLSPQSNYWFVPYFHMSVKRYNVVTHLGGKGTSTRSTRANTPVQR